MQYIVISLINEAVERNQDDHKVQVQTLAE